MNAVVQSLLVNQDDILRIQDELLKGDTIPDETEHYFADGVYARLMKAPTNTYVIGKAHRTAHISILLKGKISVTKDDGTVTYMEAPAIYVVPPGKKKMAYVIEEMWFVNIHPTDTEDLDAIESRVIIPEPEYRALLETQKQGLLEAEGAI